MIFEQATEEQMKECLAGLSMPVVGEWYLFHDFYYLSVERFCGVHGVADLSVDRFYVNYVSPWQVEGIAYIAGAGAAQHRRYDTLDWQHWLAAGFVLYDNRARN